MPINKKFKNVEEQVCIQIKERNLNVKNQTKLENILKSINYFDLINGFETLFLIDKNDKKRGYKKNTNLDDFMNFYNFDRCLNLEIMKTLGILEIKLKTKISYYFSQINSNSTSIHINYLDKNFYRCPALTSYAGSLLEHAYQKDTFVFFRRYSKKLNSTRFQINKNGQFTYADLKKNSVPYVGRYNYPPLWVIIKQLTFGDIFIFVGLLQKNVLDLILLDLGLTFGDREYLLNCLDVFKDLRNHCAHFELINRFRTPGNMNLKIISSKISLNSKSPISASGNMYRIPLYDVIKILSTFVEVDNIVNCITKFYSISMLKHRKSPAKSLLDRMGEKSIIKWYKLK